MTIRQLFEPDSSTYTYLLACPQTRQAVLLDPVIETIERDLAEIQRHGRDEAAMEQAHRGFF